MANRVRKRFLRDVASTYEDYDHIAVSVGDDLGEASLIAFVDNKNRERELKRSKKGKKAKKRKQALVVEKYGDARYTFSAYMPDFTYDPSKKVIIHTATRDWRLMKVKSVIYSQGWLIVNANSLKPIRYTDE